MGFEFMKTMKLKGHTLPGYSVYEYFLILSLPLSLQQEILELRKNFVGEYNPRYTIKGKPSLALAHFLQYEELEERILLFLKKLAEELPPLVITLKNFASFPSHTIYIKPLSDDKLYTLIKGIQSGGKKLMRINEKTKPMFMSEPHISISRKLTVEEYETSWPKYNNAHFNGEFSANEMILLKRPHGEKSWMIAGRFEFLNQQVSSTQGKLF